MKRSYRFLAIAFTAICLFVSVCVAAPLESWNETPNKERIINFVSSVSDPANPSYVPEKERIAAFDLDGRPISCIVGFYTTETNKPSFRAETEQRFGCNII